MGVSSSINKMIAQRLLKTFTSGQAALTRSMSMWSAGFEDPIPHKNEIKNAKVTGKKCFLKPNLHSQPTFENGRHVKS